MTFHGIYAIVDDRMPRDPLEVLEASLAAGIGLIQYRAKDGLDWNLLRAMLARTGAAGARLIVNDYFDAALEADGWHAGQGDLSGRDVPALRQRLGSRIFGISVAGATDARVAEASGADYLGVGPFAPTLSKDDARAAIGVAGIARVVAATRLPVVAIGGIGLAELPEVVSSGAAMAAVIGALGRAPDPAFAARDLVRAWKHLAG
jgi:thiamine-phosphate pyrophosphorylase